MLDNYPYLDIYYPYIDSMKVAELPLFEHDYKIVKSDKATISPMLSEPKAIEITEYPTGIYEKVNTYFQEQDSDLKRIDFLRDLLGEKAIGISDSDLANYYTEILTLVDSWADEFEKVLFGMPLQELIGTK